MKKRYEDRRGAVRKEEKPEFTAKECEKEVIKRKGGCKKGDKARIYSQRVREARIYSKNSNNRGRR